MLYTALVDSHSLPRKTSKSGSELVRCQVFTWKCALCCNSLRIFLTSQLPEMVRDHWLLTLLSWKCAPQLPEVVLGCQAFTLWTSKCATAACTFWTSQHPKVVRGCCVLHILTWKCALCHNGVHFFDISMPKSALRPSVFYTFDLQMFLCHNGADFFDIATSKSGPT